MEAEDGKRAEIACAKGSTNDGGGFIQRWWEEDYSKGVYLAGVEVVDEAVAPEGWVKWRIPGYEYLCVKCTEEDICSLQSESCQVTKR